MKTFKSTLFVFVFLFLTLIQTKAQDDISGWYVDGIKMDKIDCYSFQDLKIAFRYNSEWEQYEYIKIHVDFVYENGRSGSDRLEKVIPLKSLKNYIKSGYVVYQVFGKDYVTTDVKAYETNRISGTPAGLRKTDLKYFPTLRAGKPVPDRILLAKVFGLTFQSTKEEFNSGCNCILKTNLYSETIIAGAYSLVTTGRSSAKIRDIEKGNGLDSTCNYTGAKVDFNKLGSQ